MTAQRAAVAATFLLGAAAAVNAAVLVGALPSTVVMGGTYASLTPRLQVFLALALLVLGCFAAILLLRAGVLGRARGHRLVRLGAWLVTGYLALNTIGNALSPTWIERGMAVLTSLAASLSFLVARSPLGSE